MIIIILMMMMNSNSNSSDDLNKTLFCFVSFLRNVGNLTWTKYFREIYLAGVLATIFLEMPPILSAAQIKFQKRNIFVLKIKRYKGQREGEGGRERSTYIINDRLKKISRSRCVSRVQSGEDRDMEEGSIIVNKQRTSRRYIMTH